MFLSLMLVVGLKAVASETLLGTYQGKTERGADCEVIITRPSEVHLTITTLTRLLSASFSPRQFDGQWHRNTETIELNQLNPSTSGVSHLAWLKLDERRELNSAQLTRTSSTRVSVTLECLGLTKK